VWAATHRCTRSVDAVTGSPSDDPFVAHRSLLFTVAYEMLGSAVEAEDVLQETWLRWVKVDQREVEHPRAYLVRIVARQALNRLRSVGRRREDYVGEWLPEPLETGPDVAADVELAESVSIAMLTVLETLAPAERVVFVLREVFRHAVRRDRRGRRQDAGRGAADRPPGTRARRRPAAAAAGGAGRAARRRGVVQGGGDHR
jgi:RNA polymerase sigma factor (sigma-70 family)